MMKRPCYQLCQCNEFKCAGDALYSISRILIMNRPEQLKEVQNSIGEFEERFKNILISKQQVLMDSSVTVYIDSGDLYFADLWWKSRCHSIASELGVLSWPHSQRPTPQGSAEHFNSEGDSEQQKLSNGRTRGGAIQQGCATIEQRDDA